MVIAVSRLPVQNFVNDTTAPSLHSFTEINLQTGQLILEFSETIDFSSFMPQFITLQNLFEPPHVQFNLTGGISTQTSITTIALNLSMEDIAGLKRETRICTYRGNCYIVASPDLIMDNAGNNFSGVEQREPGIIVQRYIFDNQNPILTSFDLDLDSNQLMLIFSEPIDLDSFEVTGFTIQASPVANISDSYTLTSGSIFSLDAVTVMVNLTLPDANAIKASNFATDNTDTYLTISSGAVLDLASPANAILSLTTGMQVNNYRQDVTPPILNGYTLNLERDVLILRFNEPVRTSTFDFTGITILSNCTNGTSFTLTSGSFLPINLPDGSIVLTIAISPMDLIAIKSDVMLATEDANTFLQLQDLSVQDVALNDIETVDCLPTSVVALDTVRLQLVAFDVNMHLGILNLTFDDVVNSATWDPTALFFQSAVYAQPGLISQLQSSTTSSGNGYSITVNISNADLFNIKSINGLARNENTTFVTLRASAIDDTSGDDVLAITDGKALRVRTYITDNVQPSLLSYILDLNTGFLNLTFDDFPNASTFVFQQFELRSRAAGAIEVLPLSTAEIFISPNAFTLGVQLNLTDLNEIKLRRNLATSPSNTFLSIQPGSVLDFFGNPVIGISTFAARQVDNFIPDSTGPEVVSYFLDVNGSTLILTFSETINSAVFQPTAITLQDSANTSITGNSYRLTGGSVDRRDGTVITVQLSDQDVTGLQQEFTIAASVESTYLAVDDTLVTDTNNNRNMIISESNAMQILSANFIMDEINPTLASFTFDLNQGTLSLTFSKVISIQDIQYRDILLQNISRGAVFGGSHKLTGGTPLSNNSNVIEVMLTPSDLNIIKINTMFGVSAASTHIAFNSTTFQDTRGLQVLPIPVQMLE